MCMRCDGAGVDDALLEIDGLVQSHGFALVPVPGAPGTPGWAYTVGLAATRHPELVMVGVVREIAGVILDDLAHEVLDGLELDRRERYDWRDGTLELRLVDVHPSHLHRGLVAVAAAYHETADPGTGPLRARQVVVPPCTCHPDLFAEQTVLDSVADGLPARGPNRGARRAHGRRARRLGS